MDWPLKIGVAVLALCLAVLIVIGLCVTWELIVVSDGMWRIVSTAGLGVLGAGFYIAVRDAIHRIKKG